MAEKNVSINGSTGENNHSESTPEDIKFTMNLAQPIFVWIIAAVEIPVMILTLFALCVLINSRRSAPVFVIHLILSDLIQISCTFMWTFVQTYELDGAYDYSLIVGMYFMACVAVERYILVSHPVWYKSHHSLKVCCVLSVIVWFVPLIFAGVDSYGLYFKYLSRSIACFIPYPIVILCFVGTCHGLSRAISLTPLKRRLILGSLFLVLVTYTFLILPFVVLGFIRVIFSIKDSVLFFKVAFFAECLLYLNPLADCLLYLFIRPDVGDLMKSVCCCFRTDRRQNSTRSRDEHSRDSSGPFACCVSVQNPASHSQTACSSA